MEGHVCVHLYQSHDAVSTHSCTVILYVEDRGNALYSIWTASVAILQVRVVIFLTGLLE